MERVRVVSSNLKDVGYDPGQNILEIGFCCGGVYQYFNVPEGRYQGLMSAGSKGTYFDRFIKKGSYRWKKIR